MSSSLHRNGLGVRNGDHHENFAQFFEGWIAEQDHDLQALLAAAAAAPRPQNNELEEEDCRLRPLIARVISHYENYYRNKSASAKGDVLPMFTPTWTSSTENLFLWVGGWRPSMAFQLLYSKSGLQLESQLSDILRGLQTRDLADLSGSQLELIDQLQRKTIRLEKEISEEEAAAQETVADSQMVELAHVITELGSGGGDGEGVEMMEPVIKGKREGMERVLEGADQLRLETLKAVVEILRPMRAVHFLIAAAELHLRIHEFGKSKDAARSETVVD